MGRSGRSGAKKPTAVDETLLLRGSSNYCTASRLLHILIRHGMRSPQQMCQLLLTVDALQEKLRDTPPVADAENRRREASDARKKLKWARKILAELSERFGYGGRECARARQLSDFENDLLKKVQI